MLAVDGAAGSPTLAQVISASPVGSTDSGGFWSQDLASDSLPNGTLSLLLVSGYDDQVVLDAGADGDLDDIPGLEVIDAVAVSDGDTGDRTYADTLLSAGFDGNDFTPGGASHVPDGTDTGSLTDRLRNDFDLAGIREAAGSPVLGEAFNTPGATNAAVGPIDQGGVCGDPVTAIGAVQGAGETTPLGSEAVSVEGVVTGDFLTGGFDDYYVQDEGDGDAATSDGIFIYAPGAPADSITQGDRIRADGTVSEAFVMTQLSTVTIDTCVTGVELPQPQELALPLTEEDYESIEGMYFTVSDSLSILEYFNYGRFGQIGLCTERQYQPTAVFAPGSADAEALLARNIASRLILDDGRTAQNPDPARHPNGDDFTLGNIFRGGDTVTGATGVIDFRFNQWALQRGADVFGLIENDDTALTTLVAVLNDEVGAGTYAALKTGPVGTDAITTAFMDKPAVVSPTGDFATLDGSVDARFLDSKNRPALAQTFTDIETSGAVTVVVNHLKSKGSSCDDVGDPTDPNGQGNCNGVRTDAAAALVDWTATDPTGTGEEKVLIVGDLNSYGKEDPITALTDGGYTDLVADYHGAEAYSYVFDGQLGC